MSSPELIASYWTIAGDVEPLGPPEREASPYDFRLRVEAAARAGFAGLGLMLSDLENVRRRYDFKTMGAILADHGLRHLEFEFLVGWLEDSEAGRAAQANLATLLDAATGMARRIGCSSRWTKSPGAILNSRKLARRAQGRMPGVFYRPSGRVSADATGESHAQPQRVRAEPSVA